MSVNDPHASRHAKSCCAYPDYVPDPKFLEAVEEFATAWEVPVLDPCPVVGKATSKDWEGVPNQAKAWPGRNHPRFGKWLIDKYFEDTAVIGPTLGFENPLHVPIAEPMIGIGGLVRLDTGPVVGCDVEPAGVRLARRLLGRRATIDVASATNWRPPTPVALTIFSPGFRQNHSAGATAHQQALRNQKRLHSMQEFGASAGNISLVAKSEHAYYTEMFHIYRNVSTFPGTGRVLVVVRNFVRNGQEVDEVGQHIRAMRRAGLRLLGVHPRDLLRPSGYVQWAIKRNPSMPWVRVEWAVAAQARCSRSTRVGRTVAR